MREPQPFCAPVLAFKLANLGFNMHSRPCQGICKNFYTFTGSTVKLFPQHVFEHGLRRAVVIAVVGEGVGQLSHGLHLSLPEGG